MKNPKREAMLEKLSERLLRDPDYAARDVLQDHASFPMEKQWIVELLIKSASFSQNLSGINLEIKEDIHQWKLELNELCQQIDRSHASESMSDLRLRLFFQGALEVGFMIGALAESAGSTQKVRSKIQSELAKSSAEARRRSAAQGWRADARRLALGLFEEAKSYTANSLGNAVFSRWDNPITKPSDPKQICRLMAEIAQEADSPIKLKRDGRANKVPKLTA